MNSKLLKLASVFALTSLIFAGCNQINSGSTDTGTDTEKTTDTTDSKDTTDTAKDDSSSTDSTDDTSTDTDSTNADGTDTAATDGTDTSSDTTASADTGTDTAAGSDASAFSGEAVTVDDIWYDPGAYAYNGYAYNVVGNVVTAGYDANGYPIVYLYNGDMNSYIILDNWDGSYSGVPVQVTGEVEMIDGQVYIWTYFVEALS